MNMILTALLAGGITLLGCGAAAQTEDRAPIKLLIGFPAGGPPDLVARKLAARLAEQSGRAVMVENRPGASGTIAAAAVAHAAPDGNTLLFGVAANLAVAPAMMRKEPYNAIKDFTPVIEVARGGYALAVRSDAPPVDFRQFVTWARQQPGKLNYASPGQGSVHHLAMEMLKASQGIHVVHIPYRSPMYAPLLAGDVQVLFDSLPGPLPLLQAGKLRVLAVTGPNRIPLLSGVPTLGEMGLPEMDNVTSWWGIVGPAGMPGSLVANLNAQFRRAMTDPELTATMSSWGIALTPGAPADFERYITSENRRWRELVQRLGVPLE